MIRDNNEKNFASLFHVDQAGERERGGEAARRRAPVAPAVQRVDGDHADARAVGAVFTHQAVRVGPVGQVLGHQGNGDGDLGQVLDGTLDLGEGRADH